MTRNDQYRRKRKKREAVFRKFPKSMRKKLARLFIFVVLAFAILLGNVILINLKDGSRYKKQVLNQLSYDSRVIPFKRGDIVDRNGTKLATSERVYNVILDVKTLRAQNKSKEAIQETTKVLVDCFGIEEAKIEDTISKKKNSQYVILQKKVTYDKYKEFKDIDNDDEKYPYLAGVWLEEDYERTYPYGTLAADLIGFTANGNVGNNGIEAYYNSTLNGTDGREYGYLNDDASREITVKEAQDGNTVVSTIDQNLQSIVEKHVIAFNEAHESEGSKTTGSKNTAVIIMNPNTGEILAESSYPNYDLNTPRDLTKYYTDEEIASMTEEEKAETLSSLWKNFCVNDSFEPGSTIKPFTMANGLDTGVINGDETYTCNGSLHVGDYDIHCSNREGHGTQTTQQVLENSCNVGMMQIGMKIGIDNFTKYQSIFGFGQFTGIDLPGEAVTSSLIYTKDKMQITDLATNAFGQNFNVTMTQIVAGFSSLVNGGNYYTPHVVKQIQDSSGSVVQNIEPTLVKKTISEKTSEQLRGYLKAVVAEGTGSTAAVEGYSMGGKTGTAEKLPRGNGKYVISFIGCVPAENPEVVIYAAIDEPNVDAQANSKLVQQLVSDIGTEAFPYLGITKE